MLMQRERFERSDVPKPSAMRNITAAITLVVCGVICLVLWNICWHKANQMNGLRNTALYDALYDQFDTTDPKDGRRWSDDRFSNCLFIIVDDVTSEKPELLQVKILVRDVDANAARICDIPLNTKMNVDGVDTYLKAYYDANDTVSLVVPVTHTANVHVSHVIVASEEIWNQLQAFHGPTLKAMLSKQTDDLETIMSDFGTGKLIAFAETLQEIGFDNISSVEVPMLRTEIFGDGTEVTVINRQDLPIELGIFVWPE